MRGLLVCAFDRSNGMGWEGDVGQHTRASSGVAEASLSDVRYAGRMSTKSKAQRRVLGAKQSKSTIDSHASLLFYFCFWPGKSAGRTRAPLDDTMIQTHETQTTQDTDTTHKGPAMPLLALNQSVLVCLRAPLVGWAGGHSSIMTGTQSRSRSHAYPLALALARACRPSVLASRPFPPFCSCHFICFPFMPFPSNIFFPPPPSTRHPPFIHP